MEQIKYILYSLYSKFMQHIWDTCPILPPKRSEQIYQATLKFVRKCEKQFGTVDPHKFPACDAADQLCSQPLDKSLNGFPDITWWQPMFPMFPMRDVLVSLASTKPHLKKTFQLWQEQDPVVVDVECIEEPSGMFHSLSLFITLLGSALIGSWDTGHQVALTLDAAKQSSAKMRLAWSSTWPAYAWMCKQ